MADGAKITVSVFIDNSPEVLAALPNAIKRALWAIGAKAEGYAKRSPPCPVDTGYLRNSITFAVGGSAPNETSYKADRPDKTGVVRSGSYGGTAPAGNYVAVGSGVEYAAAQELGSSRGIQPHHFIKDAVANHTSEYKETVRDSLENA